jgi:hypothetical protein
MDVRQRSVNSPALCRRVVALAADAAAMVPSVMALSGAAETNPMPRAKPQLPADLRLEAPIGHRQPRPQDPAAKRSK